MKHKSRLHSQDSPHGFICNPEGVNIKNLAKDLLESDTRQFSFILSPGGREATPHKIERIYSKDEIRKMVCDHLIPDYQHERIISAVTEYIYGIHVAN